MTQGFKLTLIWLAGCLLAFVVAMNYLPAALVDGHYIPVSIDSFYHARRILDTAANPSGFYEFDTLMHVPEGSWISWPWGYDYGMAQIVRAVLAVTGPRDPMAVLDYIPVYAVSITIALVLAITSALRLSLPMRALVVASIALSPLTQSLHGVGAVDHHFAEHICVLLAVLFGVLWLRAPQPSWWATALGVSLGMSVAIHNGLFLLQLPVLGALLLQWFRGQALHPVSAWRLAGGLLGGTLLATLPAQAIHAGLFEFYLLSWFHVYVAACSAVFIVLLGKLPFSRRGIAILAGAAVLLMAPLVPQAIRVTLYAAGQTDILGTIQEVESPIHMAFGKDPGIVARLYGMLGWLAPLSLVIALIGLVRDRRPQFTYFWVVSVLMLTLLLMQYRFFDYGSIAMFVIPFWALDQLRVRWPARATPIVAAASILTVVALVAPLKILLFSRFAPSLDPEYANSREIWPAFAQACAKAPGVALGNSDYGHYIRFHTKCSVIANNFLVTPEDTEKVHFVRHLYSLSPEALLKEAPQVRYVVAKVIGPYFDQPDGTRKPTDAVMLAQINERLNAQLIITPVAALPPRFRLLSEVSGGDDLPFPITRLFEILPPDTALAAGAPTP